MPAGRGWVSDEEDVRYSSGAGFGVGADGDDDLGEGPAVNAGGALRELSDRKDASPTMARPGQCELLRDEAAEENQSSSLPRSMEAMKRWRRVAICSRCSVLSRWSARLRLRCRM